MPVSESVAAAQVKRFRNFPNFPANDGEAQKTLVRAFKRAGRDDGHAGTMGDWLEDHLHFAPLPADVFDAAKACNEEGVGERTPAEWVRPPDTPLCAYCHDTGFISTERDGISFAQRCDHTPGMAQLKRVSKPGEQVSSGGPAQAMEATSPPATRTAKTALKPITPAPTRRPPPELPPHLQAQLERERAAKTG